MLQVQNAVVPLLTLTVAESYNLVSTSDSEHFILHALSVHTNAHTHTHTHTHKQTHTHTNTHTHAQVLRDAATPAKHAAGTMH